MQACLQKAGITVGGAPGAADQGKARLREASAAAAAAERRPRCRRQPQGRSPSAFRPGLQRLRTTITTPEQTLRQVVNPPQTNITSTA